MDHMDVIIDGISKQYKNSALPAIHGIQLSIKRGEIFGLIGPDGAGKTTLFRMLTTLILPDSGKASVCGYDVVNDYTFIRKIAGYMPGKFSLYQDLTVQENIEFFATIFDTTFQKNRHLIEEIYIQLEPFKDRPAGKLSGGMKQKLALCCALIHEPKILFLDEPTTGVDPVSRKEFWDMLARLKSKDITIVVSTPYMDEASRCDRIGLLHHGTLLTVDTLDNIILAFSEKVYAVKAENIYKTKLSLAKYEIVKSAYSFGDSIHVILHENNTEDALHKLLNELDKQAQCSLITPTIEDVFMSMGNHNVKS